MLKNNRISFKLLGKKTTAWKEITVLQEAAVYVFRIAWLFVLVSVNETEYLFLAACLLPNEIPFLLGITTNWARAGQGDSDVGLERNWVTNSSKAYEKPWALFYGVTAIYLCLLRTCRNLVPLKLLLFACQSQMERCTSPWLDGLVSRKKWPYNTNEWPMEQQKGILSCWVLCNLLKASLHTD